MIRGGWMPPGIPKVRNCAFESAFTGAISAIMDLELTIDDARMYTRPFTVKVTEVLLPDSDVLEFVCTDNEKDRAHLPDQ